MEHINKSLNKKLNQLSLNNTAQSAFICFGASEIGKKYNFEAVMFKNEMLFIKTKNNYIAQEIRFNEQQIIEEINKKTKKNSVKKIIYRIG